MRAVVWVAVCLATAPAWSSSSWRVLAETPSEVVSVDLASLERNAGIVGFRQRHVILGRQIDPGSLRPMREVLIRRVVDCSRGQAATLSRAVFSDHDALIDYRGVRPQQAEWQVIAKDAPVYKLVCGAL